MGMAVVQQLNLPVGYRFDPKDAEVILYLRKKVLRHDLPSDAISVTYPDPYSHTPHQLPLFNCTHFKKNEWFFFATRPACDLMNRNLMTDHGFYRCSYEEPVSDGLERVGYKRKFIFYQGMPYTQTEWAIYEYRLDPTSLYSYHIDDFIRDKIPKFVVCKVVRERPKKSSTEPKDSAALAPSSSSPSINTC